jgi:D-aminopeptidase
VTFRSRKRSEKQELELNVDWVHCTDPSSRVPIAVLSPDSRAERPVKKLAEEIDTAEMKE